MYRLVVTLTILSLPGSGAFIESGPKWSFAGKNDQTQKSPQALKGTLLESVDAQIADGMEYYEFLVASQVAEDVVRPGDEYTITMFHLLQAFADLKGIKKYINTQNIKCHLKDLLVIIKFEKRMNRAIGGRLDKIDSDLDLFMVKEFSWMAREYLTYCMQEAKEDFDGHSDTPFYKEKLDLTREFEIFVDEQKAAQKQGSPRYCNDEVQKFEWVRYWKLASKVGTEAGEIPLIIRDNISYFGAEKTKDFMREYYRRTCDNVWFYFHDDCMEFIMSAKRSLKLNREWISKFDCGKTMGRYQLCYGAKHKFYTFG